MFFLYISPEGSPIYTANNNINGIERFEDTLLDIVSEFPDDDIVLAGDLNARCGLLQDVIEEDNVDFIFHEQNDLYEEDTFDLKRQSKDNIINNFGRSLIELCKSFGIHMLNGRVLNDNEGNFTCTANNGCSLVDYVIVSSNLFTNILYFDIGLRSESDHFPLLFKLSCIDKNVIDNEHGVNENSSNNFDRFKWKEIKKDEFLEKFKGFMTDMKTTILNTIPTDLNLAVNMIVNMYTAAAKPMKVNTNKFHINSKQPIWWDENCDKMKRDKYTKLRLFRSNSTPENLTIYKRYKKLTLSIIVKPNRINYMLNIDLN